MSRNTLFGLIIGFVLGIASLGWVAYESAPRVMILEDESQLSYEETVATLKAAAAEQGWKIPKVYEMDKTMARAGYQVAPVTVFELCHIDHAAKVLADADSRVVTSMMPCRVSVYVDGQDRVIVSRMNAGAVAQVFNENVAGVMKVASQETEAIVAAVISPTS